MEKTRESKTDGQGAAKDCKSEPNSLKTCTTPVHIIGVQSQTPVCWSSDGVHFAYASENHSIIVCKFEESKDGGDVS